MNRTLAAFPILSEAVGLIDEGRLEEAAGRVVLHLRQNPNEPRGLAQLGNIALQLGALGQAEQFLRQAIAQGARDIETRQRLASAINQQERLDEACAHYELLERESDDPTLPAIRAIILAQLGRSEAAITIQERMTRTHGDRPHVWIAYGHSLRAAGRVPEAIDAYRSAIAVDPENGEAWWGLASIKSKVLTDDDISTMEAENDGAVDVRNSAPMHFALARALHDRKRYDAAFRHYAEGNRQRAEQIGYDARELSGEISETVGSFDASYFKTLGDTANGDSVPVFIVSLPRSGSTLLEQMLGSHAAVEPIGELPYIPALLRTAMELATRSGRITVPRLIASLDDAQANALGAEYLRRAALHRRSGTRYFVDKLPHNWSNILFVRRILPQARFVDIRRPAMDCCFSNFTQSFSTAHASSFALDDIGQCYVDYVRLMDHLDLAAPGLVHHVGYERLIAEPAPELRAALDYLSLPWDPAILDFHKLDRVVRTPSSEQVRRPLNRDGVGIWEPYAAWLGPLRQVLGDLAT